MGHDVTNDDPRVREMLERHVPLRLDAQADWAGALHRAEGEGSTDAMHVRRGRLGRWLAARMRRRRLLAPALGIAVLVIAGAATAAGVHLWSGASSPSAIDTKEATSLVEYTLTSDYSVWTKGQTLAIWRVPQADGSVCVFRALASPKPTAPGTGGPNPGGGGSCGSPQSHLATPERPINLSFGATLGPAGYSWLISGNVSSASGISKLELRSAVGVLPLAYEHGWFLGQLPSSTSSSELPQGGPYVVVGYDSQGKAVAHLDLQRALQGGR